MTIEIRQLVIRAVADARPDAAPRPAAATAEPALPGPATLDPSERDALVAACTREVLRALKKARER